MMTQLGVPLPKHLQKKKQGGQPKYEQWMAFYFRAHTELSTERTMGMGPGPIPISAIAKWCDRYHFNEFEFEDMKFFISKLEVVWSRWVNKAAKKKEKDDSRKDDSGPGRASRKDKSSGRA